MLRFRRGKKRQSSEREGDRGKKKYRMNVAKSISNN
jgi:hypothetical protein